MTGPAYQVKLENIFEGPMDLLVHLIKKNQVDICDIPIALITDQFLSYIRWMQDMEIDVAADFLVMAATLAHIKSKMLLPAQEADQEETEDPRDAIAGPLAEYMRIKSAAQKLANRNLPDRDIFTRPPPIIASGSNAEDIAVKAELYELASVYHAMTQRLAQEPGFMITQEKISVKDKMMTILDLLEISKSITFNELAARCCGRAEIIATFLAILEVARLNLIGISQEETSGGLKLFSR
jgi:segregation and condensation protein A